MHSAICALIRFRVLFGVSHEVYFVRLSYASRISSGSKPRCQALVYVTKIFDNFQHCEIVISLLVAGDGLVDLVL